ncbi:MAG: hypothetical protein ACR2LN_05000 [Candidatus Levyibacteriota bacterium]
MIIIGVILSVLGILLFLGALWLYLHVRIQPDQRALIRHIVRLAQTTKGYDSLAEGIIAAIRSYEQETGIQILRTNTERAERDD